jgi:hypothetical protein
VGVSVNEATEQGVRELIYLSRRRLDAFFPNRPPRSLPSANLELKAMGAKVNFGPPSAMGTTQVELKKLHQVTRHLEREAAYFTAPGLTPGKWIFFELEMGYGTSHKDSRLPNLDDVVFFYGSLSAEAGIVERPLDLLLCGSTEHLLTKSASAGRMGSGTEWLYDLIMQIESLDSLGNTEIPDALTAEALAVPRVNRPEMVVRWVFDVIARHHPPGQRAKFHGLARVNFIVPETELSPRLIVATPLFIQFASPKPMRWVTRFRLYRDLCRRHGRPWFKWRPDLPPSDRKRIYSPNNERISHSK